MCPDQLVHIILVCFFIWPMVVFTVIMIAQNGEFTICCPEASQQLFPTLGFLCKGIDQIPRKQYQIRRFVMNKVEGLFDLCLG